MRKLAASVVLLAVPVLGAGAVAAQSLYPPGAATLTLSPSTVAPGGTFTATLSGCTLGETDRLQCRVSDSDSAACSGGGGGAARGIMQPAGEA